MKVKSTSRRPDKKNKQYTVAPLWSEPAFRELADNIIDGVYCINPDGYLAFVNRAMIDRSGISSDKFYASHFLDIIHPAYRDLAAQNFKRVISGDNGIPYELRYERADGQERIAEVHSNPMRIDGKVVGLIGISRDVTERKRAEETLKESEKCFSVAFHVNPAPMTISTIDDGVILDVNARWLSMLGYARNEMIGQEHAKLPIWLDYEATSSFIGKFLKEGFLRGESVQLRTKSGEIRDTLWSAELIKYRGREVVLSLLYDITERKRAEIALQKSEERFRCMVETTRDIIYTIDVNGVLTYVNPTAETLMGYSIDELKGKSFEQIVAPECIDLVKDRFKRAMKGEFIPVYEIDMIRKDGARLPIEFNGVTIYDSEGKPSGRYGVGRDITERKQAEEALRASELRYQAIFENTGTTMLIVEEDMTIVLANCGFESLTGYKREEIEGKKKWTEFVEKGDLEKMITQHQFREEGSGLAKKNYEFRLVHRDGHVKNIILTVNMIPGTERSVASLMDITDRKKAEDALRISEERHRLITDNMSDMIRFTDMNGKILYYSPSHEKILGYSPEDRVGKNIEDFWHQEDRERIHEELRNALTSKSLGKIDYRIRAADGHYVWLETARDFVSDADGNIKAVIFSSRDITERKRTEDELAKYREGLEQLVAERTQGLEDKTKALEEVNISLKVLLRHREEDKKELEDRFVMNIKKLIMPFAEKMKRTRLDEQQLAYLSIIEKHLNDITSSLTKRMHQFNFTPTEVEVASLLNEGKTTKEIAKIIGIATSSINTHRNQIRKKLGISKKKVNLRSHLQSFD